MDFFLYWANMVKEQDGISISEQFRLEMRYEAIFLLNGNHKEISLKVWLLSIVQILCQTERWRKEQDKNGQNKIWETCNYNTQVKVWKNFRKGYFINSINCFRGGRKGKGNKDIRKLAIFIKPQYQKWTKEKPNSHLLTQKRKIINYTAFCFNFLQVECIMSATHWRNWAIGTTTLRARTYFLVKLPPEDPLKSFLPFQTTSGSMGITACAAFYKWRGSER